MLLINKYFLNVLHYGNIQYIFILIKVYEINVRKHNNFKWFKLNFYIDNKFVNDIRIIVYFKYKIYIVDDLRVKLLINNNILKFKLILIYLKRRELIINSCEITTLVFIKVRNNQIKKIIKSFIVLAHTIITIFMKYKNSVLFTNYDHFFSLKLFTIVESFLQIKQNTNDIIDMLKF